MCPRNNLFQFWTSKKWGPSQADGVSCLMTSVDLLTFCRPFRFKSFLQLDFPRLFCGPKMSIDSELRNLTGSKESTDTGQDSKDNSGSRS